MPRHYMIDIETWDTAPSAVIRAIAIVGFDLKDGHYAIDATCTSIADCRRTVDQQIQAGRTVSAETVAWWATRAPLGPMLNSSRDVANVEVFEPHSLTGVVENLLEDLHDLHTDPTTCIWSRGHFDIAILEDLLQTNGRPVPWRHNQVRDVRTLDEITPPIESQMPHHPLADCLAQIGQVCAALRLARADAQPEETRPQRRTVFGAGFNQPLRRTAGGKAEATAREDPSTTGAE
ncbi:MAG: 3'-5' exonuclease [Candidatus Delongbacteria bacterium]